MPDTSASLANQSLAAAVQQPNYDRSRLKSRIAHLGFGAFHRAHQALYTSEMLDKTQSDWGICEINLFSSQLIEQLRQQNHLFSVLEKGPSQQQVKVCGAITESLHPKLDGIAAVINKLADPDIKIVSLTITEKGYCVDLSNGHLDSENPLISADLKQPEAPQSAIGYIVAALKNRRANGLTAFTVMSCDNMPNNSSIAKQAIIDYATLIDSSLAEWIEREVSFPCTMVDRIVPAMTAQSNEELSQALGVDDPCGVVCEPFRQWVIEDNFVNGRPDWDLAGAHFVDDVTPFEEMKLRMLNGSHSFLAYLGYLGGYSLIYQAIQNATYRNAVTALMTDEQAPSLSLPDSVDLNAYAESLIERFANTAIAHETYQIATDGSQKLPQRVCESLRYHLALGNRAPWLTLTIAGWMMYVCEQDEQGNRIEVRDPMLATIRQHRKGASNARQLAESLLAIEPIFGQDLRQNLGFVTQLSEQLDRLHKLGAEQTIQETLQATKTTTGGQ
ncbi:fructuronate reductase [Reinekea thalattae]|uniref:Fructuronate reductase n=1 Tax=Reinekea thalattae TaxID=2593301 RepID=A0A5C8ZCG5_9GAMM|nr:fructuronate reductase [Reinekea thalattae]